MIKPFNAEYWQGRVDVEDGIRGKRWHQLVQEFPKEHQAYLEKSVVFLGFASDEGVRRNKGRAGAAKAPNQLRKMLSVLPQMDAEVTALYDYGNIMCVGHQLEEAREEQINVVKDFLAKKTYPFILGGGHEVAYGNFLALNERYSNIGIINIDAHLDMRLPNPETNSGTGFYEMAKWSQENQKPFNYLCVGVQQIANTKAIFDRAEEYGAQYIMADEVLGNTNYLQKVEKFIAGKDVIYLSLDMDVFDAAFAPGVSAANVCGLHPFHVKQLLQTILKHNKVRLADVAELNPEFDVDNRTAKLAALMVSEIVHQL